MARWTLLFLDKKDRRVFCYGKDLRPATDLPHSFDIIPKGYPIFDARFNETRVTRINCPPVLGGREAMPRRGYLCAHQRSHVRGSLRSWNLLFNNRNARTALPSPHFYTTSPIDSFCLSQPTRRENSPSVHRGSTALAGRKFALRVTFSCKTRR